MILGVLGMVIALMLIPWLFARAVCPEIAYTQIATTTPEEGVLQNGFLGTLIAVLIGQFPVYFMAVNDVEKYNWVNTLIALVSLVLLIVWIEDLFWCEECVNKLEEGELEAYENDVCFLPITNSPRMGVCGYEGSDIYPEQFEPDIPK